MSSSSRLKIGLLGAGMIATCEWGVLRGFGPIRDRAVVTGITSRTRATAERVAAEFAIPAVFDSLADLLASDVDAVVNLTPGPVHAEGSRAILEAGKHLVTEKPLANTLSEATELIDLARRRGLIVVCSPPRMIEPTRILARRLVASGAIGPVAFARVRSSHAGAAWRAWPVDPAGYYAADSGPLLDMGVYGIDEITGILGPARRVSASSSRTSATRVVAGGPFDGRTIPVEADDNVLLTLEFDDNIFATVDSTFNVRASRAPAVEIFGHAGTIALNDFVDDVPPVEIFSVDADGVDGSWADATDDAFAEAHARNRELRRASLIDHLLDCLDGATPVLTGEHARHTLEIILAAERSAREGRRIDLETTF